MSYTNDIICALHHKEYRTFGDICARVPHIRNNDVSRLLKMLVRNGLAEAENGKIRKMSQAKVRGKQLPLFR